jgi:hypothetical protein
MDEKYFMEARGVIKGNVNRSKLPIIRMISGLAGKNIRKKSIIRVYVRDHSDESYKAGSSNANTFLTPPFSRKKTTKFAKNNALNIYTFSKKLIIFVYSVIMAEY